MEPKQLVRWIVALAVILSAWPGLASAAPAAPTLLTVNTTSDENDGSCTDGDCSLRDAIIIANTLPGPDTIEFDIPLASCMGGACTIYPTTALPGLTGGGTTIDGYTQADAHPATATTPADLRVVINGVNPVNCNGLELSSAGNSVRGLVINNYDYYGLAIGTAAATGNVVSGNYIGTDRQGMLDFGNGYSGVFVGLAAAGNTVGGDEPAERNVIVGNGWAGVSIHGANTSNNTVSGNYIGVTPGGAAAMGNALDGVWVYGGAHDNTVGGNTASRRNLIGGNGRNGVRLEGSATTANTVSGNYIGVTANGEAALGNTGDGVRILGGAHDNTLGGVNGATAGGECAGACNLISANGLNGIAITGDGSDANRISGNYLGTDAKGLLALPNSAGVMIETGAVGTVIGGAQAGLRNVIAGNENEGIYLGLGAGSTTVQGNYIGATSTGAGALPNSTGVAIHSAENQIGGAAAGQGNLISGNSGGGVIISDSEAYSNTVAGNRIGVNANGTEALPNDDGVWLYLHAHGNTIGGTTAGARNLISGNTDSGIELENVDHNFILGNFIGPDASGLLPLGNGQQGVLIASGSHHNTIGGDTPGERNVISANGMVGVIFQNTDTANNTLAGNYIGLSANGAAGMGNFFHGVELRQGANHNIIGGVLPGEGNLIAAHGNYGVFLMDAGTTQNLIAGNWFGLDAAGTGDLGNGGESVMVTGNAAGNGFLENTITNSGRDGALVDGAGALRIYFSRNRIFANGGLGINLENNANDNIPAPTDLHLTYTAAGVVVSGQTCASCIVEIFESEHPDGEGERYLAEVEADAAGNFSWTAPLLHLPFLTFTSNHIDRGTSEFSEPMEVSLRSLLLPLVLNH